MEEKKTGIFLIGGSTGSLKILLKILPNLQTRISFPVVIIIHRRPHPDSILTALFAQNTNLPVWEAEDKMTIRKGNIYIVPPDYHLLFENSDMISLDFSEKLNFSRPSIDITFSSAADIFQKNTVALLLSGANADGVDGLKQIKLVGGTVLVQAPETAEIPYMPAQAIRQLAIDQVLQPQEIAAYINQLSI